jgi:lipooligosaccharide transport system permease protein
LEDQFPAAFIGTIVLSCGVRNRFQRPYRQYHLCFRETSYVRFIAPALVAINIMNSSFFENTFSSFVRMYYQKTFDAMMATPLNAEEIITGEIVWGATKAAIGTTIMLTVISFFGLVSYPSGILIILAAFLGGIAFGSVGMLFTSVVKTIELFNLPIFLLVTPMFLFSGTFFPLTNLPLWAQYFALVLPLTHLVNLVRALSFGLFNSEVIDQFMLFNCFLPDHVPSRSFQNAPQTD